MSSGNRTRMEGGSIQSRFWQNNLTHGERPDWGPAERPAIGASSNGDSGPLVQQEVRTTIDVTAKKFAGRMIYG